MSKTEEHAPKVDIKSDSSMVLYRRLLGYAWPYRVVFFAALIGMAVTAAADVGFTRMLKSIIDGGFVERDNAFLQSLPFYLIGIFALRGIGTVLANYSMSWVARRTVYDLRQQIFDHSLRLPIHYFESGSRARLSSRLVYDVEQVATAATNALRVLVQDSLTVIALLAYMLYVNWQLTGVFFLLIPILYGITRSATKRYRRANRNIQDAVGGISQVAREAYDGQRVVKNFNGYAHEARRFADENERNRSQAMKRAAVYSLSLSMSLFVVGLAVAAIIWMATRDSASISAGEFVSYLGAIIIMMSPIRRLGQINDVIQSGVAAAESLFSVLDTPAEPRGGDYRPATIEGRIAFDGVSFSYPDAAIPAVDDIRFKLDAGGTIALVGPSGSGKSTLSALLLGLYPPTGGKISVDDRPIEDFDIDALRRGIALVSQDTVLFDDSIRNNIAYGEEAIDDERLQQVVKAAHVDEFTSKLPKGLDTRVGDRGALLSGGQRQRIAIARALYRDAPILVLDEATSALDNQSEKLIQDALETLIKGRTTLIIAHRLSTVRHAGRILVMNQGRIAEDGSHEQLMDLQGIYYALQRAAEHE
ncbi:lipid A export permease/ATP-binding protein MsbA [Gammaproteobacteria bacterium]|nr:lipid A export permease/ATP-binding protein MsbA [Gammaproteobacteria bacterium]